MHRVDAIAELIFSNGNWICASKIICHYKYPSSLGVPVCREGLRYKPKHIGSDGITSVLVGTNPQYIVWTWFRTYQLCIGYVSACIGMFGTKHRLDKHNEALRDGKDREKKKNLREIIWHTHVCTYINI